MRRFFSILVLSLTLLGCGGGVEGTGGDLKLPDPTTRINTLSDAERAVTCESIRLQAYDATSQTAICTYKATTMPRYWGNLDEEGNLEAAPLDLSTPAKAKAACLAGVENCMKFTERKTFENECEGQLPFTCVLQDNSFVTACDIELGLLLQCVEEQVASIGAANKATNCSQAFDWQKFQEGITDKNPLSSLGDLTPTCSEIATKCGFAGYSVGPCGSQFF